jgi:hypothetical protein
MKVYSSLVFKRKLLWKISDVLYGAAAHTELFTPFSCFFFCGTIKCGCFLRGFCTAKGIQELEGQVQTFYHLGKSKSCDFAN